MPSRITINCDIDLEESNNLKSVGSVSSKISGLEKLDSSAISSLRIKIRDDSTLITKLCSQGLLDSISNTLDKILLPFVGTVGNSKILSKKVDVAILRALIHGVFMICERIFESKKYKYPSDSRDEHGDVPPRQLYSTETSVEKICSFRSYVRGISSATVKVVKDTSCSSQDMMRISSLIERGLLCNDERWVSKALNTSKQRTASSSSSNKMFIDLNGDSINSLAISFGCSMNILKCLIEANCIVTNSDIKAAAVSNQADTLLLLLRYASYEDGSLDLNLCTEGIRDILENAVERQKKEGSYLAEVGYSFISDSLTKLLHILYTVHDNIREPKTPSYYHEIAQLLQSALFGNLSTYEESFDMTILKDAPLSSRVSKGRFKNHPLRQSSLFQLLPEDIVSQAI